METLFSIIGYIILVGAVVAILYGVFRFLSYALSCMTDKDAD
jgi:hypothetical protein